MVVYWHEVTADSASVNVVVIVGAAEVYVDALSGDTVTVPAVGGVTSEVPGLIEITAEAHRVAALCVIEGFSVPVAVIAL